MRTININKKTGGKFFVFPDGQPHVNIESSVCPEEFDVICSITSTLALVQLLQVANAIDNCRGIKRRLYIPYLMGARSDRIMIPGDSIDLKVIAGLINSLKFDRVILLDVHSDTALVLIERCIHIKNTALIHKYTEENVVLISPDAGSAKKVPDYFAANKNITGFVQCTKHRDLSTGKVYLDVLNKETCTDKNCVIIDDICDGGVTFLAIADQVKPKHLTLIVTHGIFSKGLDLLSKKFNQIITTDSIFNKENFNSSGIDMKVISCDELMGF